MDKELLDALTRIKGLANVATGRGLFTKVEEPVQLHKDLLLIEKALLQKSTANGLPISDNAAAGNPE